MQAGSRGWEDPLEEGMTTHSDFFFFFFSSTSLLLPTHLPPPSCMCSQSCNLMDCSLPGSSVYELFQARILDGLPFPFPPLQYFCLENPGQRNLAGYSPSIASQRVGHD